MKHNSSVCKHIKLSYFDSSVYVNLSQYMNPSTFTYIQQKDVFLIGINIINFIKCPSKKLHN